MILLRCTELTSLNGFPYFILVNSKIIIENEKYVAPFSTNIIINPSDPTKVNSITTSAMTSAGGLLNFRSPYHNNTVIMYKEKPNYQGIIYNSDFILKSIGKKYGIKVNK